MRDNAAKEDKKAKQKIRIRMMLQKLRKKRQVWSGKGTGRRWWILVILILTVVCFMKIQISMVVVQHWIAEDGKMTVYYRNLKNTVQLFLETAKDTERWRRSDRSCRYRNDWIYTVQKPAQFTYTSDVPVKKPIEERSWHPIEPRAKWYDHKVSVSNPAAK